MTGLSIKIKTLSDIKAISEDTVFTCRELSCSGPLTLAGNLAAKEAFLDSLRIATPFHAFLNKVEVLRTEQNKPYIETGDSFILEKLAGRKTSVSISHNKTLAIAVCIIYN